MKKLISSVAVGLSLLFSGCSDYEDARDPVLLVSKVQELYPNGKVYLVSKYTHLVVTPSGDIYYTESMNNFDAEVTRVKKLVLISEGE